VCEFLGGLFASVLLSVFVLYMSIGAKRMRDGSADGRMCITISNI